MDTLGSSEKGIALLIAHITVSGLALIDLVSPQEVDPDRIDQHIWFDPDPVNEELTKLAGIAIQCELQIIGDCIVIGSHLA